MIIDMHKPAQRPTRFQTRIAQQAQLVDELGMAMENAKRLVTRIAELQQRVVDMDLRNGAVGFRFSIKWDGHDPADIIAVRDY